MKRFNIIIAILLSCLNIFSSEAKFAQTSCLDNQEEGRKSCGLSLSSSQSTYTITPSQAAMFNPPKALAVSGYDGAITYKSSNPSIISVSEATGELSFHSAGTVTIRITASTTDRYFGATISYTIIYGKKDPELAFVCGEEVTIPVGIYPSKYDIYVKTSTTAGVTITSSDKNVVFIDTFNGIHIGRAGTAILTATVPETETFLSGSATCTVHVVESMSSDCKFDYGIITVEFGQEAFFTGQKATAAKGYNGTITYSSEHPEVATVDAATGAVTFVTPGSTRIYAQASGTDSFIASSDCYTLNYTKAKPTLSFSSSILQVKLSQGTASLPAIINPSGGEVTYRSSNPSVVSVDPQTGTLTLLKVGKATITASLKETEYYNSASVTCEVQVISDGTEIAILDIANPGLTFEAVGGEKRFKLRTDRNWTASAGQPWVTVTPSSGEPTFAQGTTPTDDDYVFITVTCSENTSTSARETSITVKSGDKIGRLPVLQNGTEEIEPDIDERLTPELIVTPSEINVIVTKNGATLPILDIYRNSKDGKVSFESSDENVVKIQDDGKAFVIGPGIATLKVKLSGTDFYKPAEAAVTINATFPDPDLIEDIEPISGNITVDFSALAGKDMSTGGVLDNIYYSFNTDLGVGDGYSEADGCVILNSTMSMEQMQKALTQTLAELDEDCQFCGIIFKVPAGEGSIILDCQTGSNPLVVQMAADRAKRFLILPRGECKVNYNVEEPTLVYIYAMEMPNSTSPLRSVRRVPKKSDATSVLIYGLKVNTVADGVSGVKADTEGEDVDLFNVGGQQVAKKNARHGVFIGTDGSKRAVK